MPNIRLQDGTATVVLSGIDSPVRDTDAANREYVDNHSTAAGIHASGSRVFNYTGRSNDFISPVINQFEVGIEFATEELGDDFINTFGPRNNRNEVVLAHDVTISVDGDLGTINLLQGDILHDGSNAGEVFIQVVSGNKNVRATTIYNALSDSGGTLTQGHVGTFTEIEAGQGISFREDDLSAHSLVIDTDITNLTDISQEWPSTFANSFQVVGGDVYRVGSAFYAAINGFNIDNATDLTTFTPSHTSIYWREINAHSQVSQYPSTFAENFTLEAGSLWEHNGEVFVFLNSGATITIQDEMDRADHVPSADNADWIELSNSNSISSVQVNNQTDFSITSVVLGSDVPGVSPYREVFLSLAAANNRTARQEAVEFWEAFTGLTYLSGSVDVDNIIRNVTISDAEGNTFTVSGSAVPHNTITINNSTALVTFRFYDGQASAFNTFLDTAGGADSTIHVASSFGNITSIRHGRNVNFDIDGTELTINSEGLRDFNPTEAYRQGQVVLYNHHLYEALSSFQAVARPHRDFGPLDLLRVVNLGGADYINLQFSSEQLEIPATGDLTIRLVHPNNPQFSSFTVSFSDVQTSGSVVTGITAAADNWFIRTISLNPNFRLAGLIAGSDVVGREVQVFTGTETHLAPSVDPDNWRILDTVSTVPDVPTTDGTYVLEVATSPANSQIPDITRFAGGGTATADATGVSRLGGGTTRLNFSEIIDQTFTEGSFSLSTRSTLSQALSDWTGTVATSWGDAQYLVFGNTEAGGETLRQVASNPINDLLVYHNDNSWALYQVLASESADIPTQTPLIDVKGIALVASRGAPIAGPADILWARAEGSGSISLLAFTPTPRQAYTWEPLVDQDTILQTSVPGTYTIGTITTSSDSIGIDTEYNFDMEILDSDGSPSGTLAVQMWEQITGDQYTDGTASADAQILRNPRVTFNDDESFTFPTEQITSFRVTFATGVIRYRTQNRRDRDVINTAFTLSGRTSFNTGAGSTNAPVRNLEVSGGITTTYNHGTDTLTLSTVLYQERVATLLHTGARQQLIQGTNFTQIGVALNNRGTLNNPLINNNLALPPGTYRISAWVDPDWVTPGGGGGDHRADVQVAIEVDNAGSGGVGQQIYRGTRGYSRNPSGSTSFATGSFVDRVVTVTGSQAAFRLGYYVTYEHSPTANDLLALPAASTGIADANNNKAGAIIQRLD